MFFFFYYRADHVMLSLHDKLFFCGGWFEADEADAAFGESGDRVLVDSVDVYDFGTDTWSVETRIPTPRFHAGFVIVGDKLYVIGGCHSDSLFDRATGMYLMTANIYKVRGKHGFKRQSQHYS